MNVWDKIENRLVTATYATTSTGNKKMNVDGKFFSDKQFSERFEEVGQSDELSFRVHTDNFLREVISNLAGSTRNDGGGGYGVLFQPINIFRELLVRAGEEAARINDHRLNKVMILLGIYSIAIPDSDDYDPEKVRRILANDLSVYSNNCPVS